MKPLWQSFFFLLLFQAAAAQKPEYATVFIPDSLRRDADVVVRDNYEKLTLKSMSSGRKEVHSVFTVMNEQGKESLLFAEYTDKFHVLDDAEIKVYDQMGNLKNTYSKREMVATGYGSGLVIDGKYTYFFVAAPSYPITVELNYTVKLKGTLYLPDYVIQPPWQSVQHSVFELETPVALGVRYKLLNTNQEPQHTIDGEAERFHWEVKDLPAYKTEKNTGARDNYEPRVLIAPTKFQMDEYDGDMTSWKNFGKWINDLFVNAGNLPEERKQFYRALVKDAASDKEKARILYTYMQHNMRYVSIQLGIGGFRPFPASFVDEKKYGDCKALSNYMRATLDVVGVKSNVLIIQGSTRPKTVYPDFPANYFNHVILCIPQAADTTWLECTSTTLPFGELGPFTENRRAMLVTDTGGVLVNTPRSSYLLNTRRVSTRLKINEQGGAEVQTSCFFTGKESDDLLMSGFHEMKDDEKRKYFFSEFEWKQPAYIDFRATERSARPFGFTANMEYEKMYAFKSGSKYFFDPRLYPLFLVDVPATEKRKYDYYFEYPGQFFDTTQYEFPKGFAPETVPAPKQIDQAFARYSCQYQWDAGKSLLTVTALLEIKERKIPAADYGKLAEFKKQLTAALNEKLVMIKE